MSTFDSPIWLEAHRRTSELRGTLYSLREGEEARVDVLKSDVSGIKKALPFKRNQAVQSICSNLEKRFQGPLAGAEMDALLEACNELRMHFMAVALWASQGGSEDREVLPSLGIDDSGIWSLLEPEFLGPIHHSLVGVTYTTHGKNLLLLMPPVHSVEQLHELLVEFARIYDETPFHLNWVIDFSLVDQFPTILVGTLIGYRKQLQAAGRNLHLCWIADEKFPQEALERLIKPFDLEQVAGHWFSPIG